jgi:hypothetical protein
VKYIRTSPNNKRKAELFITTGETYPHSDSSASTSPILSSGPPVGTYRTLHRWHLCRKCPPGFIHRNRAVRDKFMIPPSGYVTRVHFLKVTASPRVGQIPFSKTSAVSASSPLVIEISRFTAARIKERAADKLYELNSVIGESLIMAAGYFQYGDPS